MRQFNDPGSSPASEAPPYPPVTDRMRDEAIARGVDVVDLDGQP
jgi:hypothetical protein